ncbi:(deoxy)nucleoside triphosphate pyrophosphohydrolase [Arthrobacter rhombi]|uniref:(deoxy)nucleoside triphosphate pyrophosphohydrolase n=1 Tax=Arthrobacter rhombi TaxID=71253 RepID=UPI003F8EFEDC
MTGLKQIVGAALVDSLQTPTRLLAARRTSPPALAGLWEFPGGKVEAGETCAEGLLRELTEELGIEADLGAEIEGPIDQGWKLAGSAAMRVWLARITAGTPEPLEDHDELRWLELGGNLVSEVPWIPADLPIVEAIVARHGAVVEGASGRGADQP